MNKVNAKVYYDNSTGEVLVITAECMGDVRVTTKVEDMEIYSDLKDKSINDIDFIELEFGALASTFENIKTYSVNVETKTLELNYYTNIELEEIQGQENAKISFSNRVEDISDYLRGQTSESITSFEDFILQNEINKEMEGMSE